MRCASTGRCSTEDHAKVLIHADRPAFRLTLERVEPQPRCVHHTGVRGTVQQTQNQFQSRGVPGLDFAVTSRVEVLRQSLLDSASSCLARVSQTRTKIPPRPDRETRSQVVDQQRHGLGARPGLRHRTGLAAQRRRTRACPCTAKYLVEGGVAEDGQASPLSSGHPRGAELAGHDPQRPSTAGSLNGRFPETLPRVHRAARRVRGRISSPRIVLLSRHVGSPVSSIDSTLCASTVNRLSASRRATIWPTQV